MGMQCPVSLPPLGAVSPSWRVAGGDAVRLAAPFGVMGILNLTPDSFYDGGRHATGEAAFAQAQALRAAGADMLDMGAESSRPGARPLAPGEELERLLPVLRAVRKRMPDIAVSVDTVHAATAAAALDMGAVVINDVSACGVDPELTDVLVERKPGYVLMHSRGRPPDMQAAPQYADVCREVREFFERELNRLVAAGLPEDRIVLDPGIGFGKTMAHNLELLAHVGEFLAFGRPLLVGVSMKSLFRDLLGLPVGERGAVTQTAAALLWERGVCWHRVHDVGAARNALRLAAALADAGAPSDRQPLDADA